MVFIFDLICEYINICTFNEILSFLKIEKILIKWANTFNINYYVSTVIDG